MSNKEKFDKFWSLYPRKVARIVAERRWKKLSKKEIDEILKIYPEHLLRWRYKDIQYVPHPATWLNQRRWEDELEPLPDKNLSVYKDIEKKTMDLKSRMKSAETEAASEDEIKKLLTIKKK